MLPVFNQSENKFDIDKWADIISYLRWMPDIFYDLITPETGGIKLHIDQRVYLRAMARFVSNYAVFPRGYGKTMLELMSLYHMAIFFPRAMLSMTAQTEEAAVRILKDKHAELIRFYPMLENEFDGKPSFSKDSATILFKNGSRIDVLANNQNTKGQRRTRLMIEEAALLDNATFQDALSPVVEVPRRTIGRNPTINPDELNGQINFLTTSGFKGSDEYDRSLKMIDDMAELKGVFVMGATWELANFFGRGRPREEIEKIRDDPTTSPTSFAQNYMSRWVGASDGALVNISKVMSVRTIPRAEVVGDGRSDYIVGVDVARSESKNNNQTSIAVLKLKRLKNGKIDRIQLVLLKNLEAGTNFQGQAIEVKKIKIAFNAKMVVVDGNGLGSGLIDELMKETFDHNGDNLGCWDTINSDAEPEIDDAEDCLFDLKAQGINHEVIVSFMDAVESGRLELLEKREEKFAVVNGASRSELEKEWFPFKQTDMLIEEVANLKLKQTANGRPAIERVTKRIDKDRYSALAYSLWYVKAYEDGIVAEQEYDVEEYFLAD